MGGTHRCRYCRRIPPGDGSKRAAHRIDHADNHGGGGAGHIVVLMVLVLIRDLTFYSHVAFFVTLLVALIVVLATEAYGVITSRVTYLSA